MQHEVLAVFTFQSVDDLLILACAQRRCDKGLGFAAGEQSRTVGARQHADFNLDGPHGLGVAAVDTHAGFQDVAANNVGFHMLENSASNRHFGGIVAKAGDGFLLHFTDGGIAVLLDLIFVSRAEFTGERGQLAFDGDDFWRFRRNLARFLCTGARQLDDQVDHRHHLLVADERVVLACLGVQHQRVGGNLQAGMPGQGRGIGADKVLPYLKQPKEDNPALGWRSIRMALERPALLRLQIRALLMAADGGPLKIMFPMISSLPELENAKAVLEECRAELRAAGLPFDLPELTADFPEVALVPILSEARAIGLVLKKWQRKGRGRGRSARPNMKRVTRRVTTLNC